MLLRWLDRASLVSGAVQRALARHGAALLAQNLPERRVGPFLADFMSGGVLPYMQAPEWENLLRRNRTEVLGAIVHQADFWIGPGLCFF